MRDPDLHDIHIKIWKEDYDFLLELFSKKNKNGKAAIGTSRFIRELVKSYCAEARKKLQDKARASA